MTLSKPELEYRAHWGAIPPKSNPGGFKSYDATVCHYTAANRGYAVPESADHERCRGQVRGIQRQHQSITNQSDIEYNALTCLHGVLFEGRVLGYKGGANGTALSNATMPSICCLLGVDDEPNQKMLNAAAYFHSRVELLAGHVIDMKKHMEITPTSCPGRPMSELVNAEFYRDLIDSKPEPKPPVPIPVEDEDVMHLISAYANGQWIVAADLSSRAPIASEADLNALLGTGRYIAVGLTEHQMAAIPAVTP